MADADTHAVAADGIVLEDRPSSNNKTKDLFSQVLWCGRPQGVVQDVTRRLVEWENSSTGIIRHGLLLRDPTRLSQVVQQIDGDPTLSVLLLSRAAAAASHDNEIEETTMTTCHTNDSHYDDSSCCSIRDFANREFPFGVRFALEVAWNYQVSLEADNDDSDNDDVNKKKTTHDPVGRLEKRKFVLIVWYSLLPILRDLFCGDTTATTTSITATQLFAHSLADILQDLQQAIAKGQSSLERFPLQVQQAHRRAFQHVQELETRLGVQEDDLTKTADTTTSTTTWLRLLQLRAQWPRVEFQCCMATTHGQLVPHQLQLSNAPGEGGVVTTTNIIPPMYPALQDFWHARDAFLTVQENTHSSLDGVGGDAVDTPLTLCGRTYQRLSFPPQTDENDNNEDNTQAPPKEQWFVAMTDDLELADISKLDRRALEAMVVPISILQPHDVVATHPSDGGGGGVMGPGIAQQIQQALGLVELPTTANVLLQRPTNHDDPHTTTTTLVTTSLSLHLGCSRNGIEIIPDDLPPLPSSHLLLQVVVPRSQHKDDDSESMHSPWHHMDDNSMGRPHRSDPSTQGGRHDKKDVLPSKRVQQDCTVCHAASGKIRCSLCSPRVVWMCANPDCKTLHWKRRGHPALCDWSTVTTWKPAMTPSFHESLKAFSGVQKNTALHTLLAICVPRLRDLDRRPIEERRCWQISTLKTTNANSSHKDLSIVWVPLEYQTTMAEDLTTAAVAGGRISYMGIIQANYAGTYDHCLRYTQTHPVLPPSARAVKSDLNGLIALTTQDAPAAAPTLDLSWLVDNDLQEALLDEDVEELPQGTFVLDADQERIVTCPPPLLLESRSGTGKTNVLFQHAMRYSRHVGAGEIVKPICFITVSSKLRQELHNRFEEVRLLNDGVAFAPIRFFSFRDFLEHMVQTFEVENRTVAEATTFLQYLQEKRHYAPLRVEQSLIENEIGGVILGSLKAALEGRPLTREDYLLERRSNVSIDSQEGQNTRSCVYDEYESYHQWKCSNEQHDVDDIVLSLIKCVGAISANQDVEIFQSVYLDEVQDFSYAMIYLICSVAGSLNRNWIASGDTAQMISSGCSFKFEGMREVLRAIQGEEVTLGKVQRLQRNYRLTKAVLDVGNAIIRVMKNNFPEILEYSQPEIAMKDLGLDVVLVDWKKGFAQSNLKFGTQQALIYSTGTGFTKKIGGTDEEKSGLQDKIQQFLPNHPFTLSSLESKGLEFDDVVVVFDFSHSAWNVSDKRINPQESIKLLRELYVAVTRAKRRVVIFVRDKHRFRYMFNFFKGLDCGINTDVDANVELLRLEFDNETTSDTWLKKGHDMFEEEQYRLAASCFKSAESYGWMNRAHGRSLLQARGRHESAKDAFRMSAKHFFDVEDYEGCLDAYKDIIEIRPWEDRDNQLLDIALQKLPDYLPRHSMVQLAIDRDSWDIVQKGDLLDIAICQLFEGFQTNGRIKEIVSNCTADELQAIAKALPMTVAAHYENIQKYGQAIDIYLLHDMVEAVQQVVDKMDSAELDTRKAIRTIVNHFERSGKNELCLDYLKRLYDLTFCLDLSWDPQDNIIAKKTLELHPSHLGRTDLIKLCLASDTWSMIKSSDIQANLKGLFTKCRGRSEMNELLSSCPPKELNRIAGVLPNIVADFYFKSGDLDQALKLYKRGKDKEKVAEVKKMIDTKKQEEKASEDLRAKIEAEALRADVEALRALHEAEEEEKKKQPPNNAQNKKKKKQRKKTRKASFDDVSRTNAPMAFTHIESTPPLPVGSRVRLVNLIKAPHLNNKTGIIRVHPNSNGSMGYNMRQKVEMDNKKYGYKEVKPENLELLLDKGESDSDDNDGLPDLVSREDLAELGSSESDQSSSEYDDLPDLLDRNDILAEQDSSDSDAVPDLLVPRARNFLDPGHESDSSGDSMPELCNRDDDSSEEDG